MRKLPTVLVTTVISIVDMATITILFCHGNKFKHYLQQGLHHFSFQRSVFDLFVFGFLRFCLTMGLSLSVFRYSYDSIYRIRKIKTVIFIASLATSIYTIIKLLIRSEVPGTLTDKWFWLIFSWTHISCLWMSLHCLFLSKIHINIEVNNMSINKEDGDEVEREPLIGSSAEQSDQSPKTTAKVTIFRLFSHSKPDIPFIIMGFIFLTISSTGQIFIPYYTGEVVDSIVIEKSQKKFTQSIIIMAVISIISSITAGCRGWCFSLAMARLGIRVRNRLFGSVIEQEIGFFDKVKTGDITSRLTSDTTVMTDTVTLNMNIFTRNLILGVGIIVFMFKLSWRLSLLTLIAFPIVLGVSKVYGEYYRDLASKVQDALAAANNVAEEALSAIRTVRSFANEDGEKDRYRTSLHKAYKINVKQANVYAGYVWCTQLFELGLTVAVLYYGGHLVLTKTLSGGNLVSFILYQMQLGNCIDEIGEVFTGLMQAAGASEKVFEYIDREPVVKNTVKDRMDTESVIGQSEVESDKISGLIEFKNVTFAYPSRPDTNVLKNVSFTVQPGEVVALVGPSGGGKSSCINLLEHYYEPITGQILLDKKPVKEYDHKFLHTKISLVGQEPVLYARSIKDNIGYGLGSDVTIETVQQAAGMANAHEFIMEMEKQYETEAGEKGQQLSGGQKQRIAIARALIRKPVVLLLDEATSALDSESEHVVQQAIYKNLKGRSVIIIAHRLSTVEKADRIIVIDKGCVIEEGSHSELLRNNGKYASLVQRQLLQTEDEVEDRVISLDNDGLGVGIAKRDIGLHFRSTCLITSSSWH
ncbi:ABC-type oligopeptide transporter ABCB9-like isoform X1 [Mytilus galloprovincialis]|uniref:ABC-type oligopeptide transporter ABCB9-like isoform X1 n=2 Tax=Mytilus galloprovincialis TaxID=29158 RepID=UPI003F7BE6F8